MAKATDVAVAKAAPRRSRFGWLLPAALAAALLVAGLSRLGHPTPTAPIPEEPAAQYEVPSYQAPEIPPVPSLEKTSETTTTSADLPAALDSKIHFIFAKRQVVPGDAAEVKKIAVAMKANPALRIRLSGHTDGVGSDASNDKLALDRAVIVRKMLVADGIDENRVAVDASGKKDPVADNDTDKGRAENRRVDVTVLSK